MWGHVLISIVVLLTSLFYHYHFSEPASIIDYPETHYDYVVVGAGTSGCVIASRLSEMSNVTVLLVEAGGYFGWTSTIPLLAPMMQGTEVDWAYKTEPQVFSSRGFNGYRQNWPRGKGLGGSGQLNYLVHSFGRPEDYKRWPKGWSHADLLPYFQKVTDIMNVVPMPEEEYLTKAFILAEESLKLDNVSLRKAMYTAKRGSRWTTHHAYLQKAWNRKNLHILMNTLVTKILFKNNNIEGIKVMYKNGSIGRIGVRKEVILCAGTINTPQLLLISGVGPISELEKHKVTYRSLFPSYNDSMHEGFIYLVSCLQPKSRGSVTLRSSDIRDPPRINPAYLQDSDDVTCTYREKERIPLAPTVILAFTEAKR
ncbi:neither inactivation nor afterpotential protein g-like protein, partial [Lasius niger]